ncbi:MAG: hypothetical protein IKK33_03060 [Lachnospiraceae bacterium]|nr:hypothetical protein [Lachnospiraceae bacterium]
MSFRSIWEVTIDVSILIVLIAIIRKIFKKYLNPNTLYFLWIFAVICIIIPIRLKIDIEMPQKAQEVVSNVSFIEQVMPPDSNLLQGIYKGNINVETNSNVSEQANEVSLYKILDIIWIVVTAIFSVFIVVVNIRLYSDMRRNRKIIGKCNGRVAVYSLSDYNCLVGILRPIIYVDTEKLKDKKVIDYIIKHEYQHYRVRDNIWQLFRTACLILQWHNPLVWWAYYKSKEDGELACDARVISNLSETERYQYGQSLLSVVESIGQFRHEMLLATSMSGGMKMLKERIELIMKYQKRRKVLLTTLLVTILGITSTNVLSIVKANSIDAVTMPKDAIVEQTPSMDIIEDTIEENKSIALNIEEFYSTNIGDPSNLYYIDDSGILWGTGRNDYGQLGLGKQDSDFHNEFIKIAENVVHVDFSQQGFTIYLTADGKLYGMGCAGTGALLEYENITDKMVWNRGNYVVTSPKLLMENVIYARCGKDDIVCLLDDGSAWTWGTVWRDARESYYIATPRLILENVALITGGWFNHAALLTDGSVWTWGYNYAGNCGTEGVVVSEPQKVADGVQMVWTGRIEYNVDCKNIADFEGIYERMLENTIILKNDGTYWACGIGIGEEKVLQRYWEIYDYSVTCTDKFMELPDEIDMD